MTARRAVPYLLPASVALLAIAVYAAVALLRIAYPYDLEWMEGAMADHVARVVAGKPLYVEPSIEFISFIYTPFYYVVSAGVWLVTGPGLLPLRLVSFVSSLACFALIGFIVRRETGAVFPAVIAAGLYAACFRAGGAWFDIARTDSLFLALALAAILLLRARRDVTGSLLVALLFFLACFTKQTALVVAASMGLWCLAFRTGWARWAFPVSFAILVVGSTLIMDAITGGWYSFYVFAIPSEYRIEWSHLPRFWLQDLGRNVPVAAAFTAVWLVRGLKGRSDVAFHLLLQGGLLAASCTSRLNPGGYSNVLLPAFAGLAIGLGLGTHALMERAGRAPARWGIALACCVQFLLLAYDPRAQIPPARDREVGTTLVRLIASFPGDVYVSGRGNLAALAGKRSFAHVMAMNDVLMEADRQTTSALAESIRASLRDRRFDALLFDKPLSAFRDVIDAGYEHRAKLLGDTTAFLPVTGYATRPELLYVRRPRRGAREDAQQGGRVGGPSSEAPGESAASALPRP